LIYPTTGYKVLDDGFVIVSTRCTFHAKDENGETAIASIEVVINSEYQTETPFSDALFGMFVYHVLQSHIWPYAREYVQNTIARMCLPSLTLPMWKAPQIQAVSRQTSAKRTTRKKPVSKKETTVKSKRKTALKNRTD